VSSSPLLCAQVRALKFEGDALPLLGEQNVGALVGFWKKGFHADFCFWQAF
jgi:hypothetical protein